MLNIRDKYPQFFTNSGDNNVNDDTIFVSLSEAVSEVLGTNAFDDNETFDEFVDTITVAFWTMYPDYKKYKVRNESKSLRKKILKERAKDGMAECDRCKKIFDISDLDMHHKIPVAWGGTNDPDNISLLCAECHKIENYKTLGTNPNKYSDFE